MAGSAVPLEIAAHNLPPVVALRRLHIHELDSYPSFAAMPDHRAHLQLSGRMIVVHTKMNFNFRSCGILNLAQDTHAHRAHICQETGRELVGRAKQNAPVGGAPGASSPFGRWIFWQSSNRNSRGLRGKVSGPRMPAEINNSLLMACERPTGVADSIGSVRADRTPARKTLRGSLHLG